MTPQSFSPVVEILRGGEVESLHSAAAAVADPSGALLASLGDSDLPVYWRSAAKPFQAWPLVETGAADRFGLGRRELALACASHGGEPRHLEVAAAMLAAGGFTPDDLQCGPHAPMTESAALDLARTGEPATALHNNCSGKHAGMLLLGRHLGAEPATYLEVDGPVQTAIRAALARATGVPAETIATAVDGCSAPTFRLPLRLLAAAYARLAATLTDDAGDGDLGRLARAMTAEPGMVAGLGRLDTALMEALPGRLIAKLGAEGIYAVGVAGADRPLGIAVKVADGDADRARTALVLALLEHLEQLPPAAAERLRESFPALLYNRRGLAVGEVRVHFDGFLVAGSK